MGWLRRNKKKTIGISRGDLKEIIAILLIVAFVLLLFNLFV
jgi:hypothetical protein